MKILFIVIIVFVCLDTFYYIFWGRKIVKDPIAQQIEAIDKIFPFSDSLSLKYKAEAIKKIFDNNSKSIKKLANIPFYYDIEINGTERGLLW